VKAMVLIFAPKILRTIFLPLTNFAKIYIAEHIFIEISKVKKTAHITEKEVKI
jgi:predicted nucleic-acid-binding protein